MVLPLAIVISAGLLTGCTAERAAHHIGAIIDAYCVVSPVARASMRESIARQIAPHSIELTCDGDPEGH